MAKYDVEVSRTVRMPDGHDGIAKQHGTVEVDANSPEEAKNLAMRAVISPDSKFVIWQSDNDSLDNQGHDTIEVVEGPYAGEVQELVD